MQPPSSPTGARCGGGAGRLVFPPACTDEDAMDLIRKLLVANVSQVRAAAAAAATAA